MTGIVIVSHSWKIAEGVRDLVLEMAHDWEDKIIAAGGLDDEDKSIGTDVEKIMNAISHATKNADNGGVVVLADMGSGVMSAETAIDLLLDSENDIKVKIADAPLVEGTVCAAVEASGGGDLDAVLKAAESSRGANKL
ncbi:MAG: PTS-dependent dihydroxyacetone kinase phosphotransferase subunit DhaM [Synergistaceae bacterium]|nr:PTS-dependent dihydroxyacetone kinase phosphotransferase subunit DhaM [Synergistaceae bacterium]